MSCDSLKAQPEPAHARLRPRPPAGRSRARRKSRRGACSLPWLGSCKIVQHIDAAAERHLPIDHAQLAVQPPPAAEPEHAQPPQRRIDTPVHAGLRETLMPLRRHRRRPEAVHHHLDAHAAPGGLLQRLRNLHTLARRSRRCRFPAALRAAPPRSRRPAPGTVPPLPWSSCTSWPPRGDEKACDMAWLDLNSAISGKWSDIRHQMRPRGISAPTGFRPRA